jgi:hypothetical protein
MSTGAATSTIISSGVIIRTRSASASACVSAAKIDREFRGPRACRLDRLKERR